MRSIGDALAPERLAGERMVAVRADQQFGTECCDRVTEGDVDFGASLRPVDAEHGGGSQDRHASPQRLSQKGVLEPGMLDAQFSEGIREVVAPAVGIARSSVLVFGPEWQDTGVSAADGDVEQTGVVHLPHTPRVDAFAPDAVAERRAAFDHGNAKPGAGEDGGQTAPSDSAADDEDIGPGRRR